MLGVGALAAVGYFIYKNNQDKKTSTGQQNAGGKKRNVKCQNGWDEKIEQDKDGKMYAICTKGFNQQIMEL